MMPTYDLPLYWRGRTIYCIDIGSTINNKFGWINSEGKNGSSLRTCQEQLLDDLEKGKKIIIGIEAPLYFEVNEEHPNQKRSVDPQKRAFSVAGGLATLVTCLTHMNILFKNLKNSYSWLLVDLYDYNDNYQACADILIFESLVTGDDKKAQVEFRLAGSKMLIENEHVKDGSIGLHKFIKSEINNKVEEMPIESSNKFYSVIGSVIYSNDLNNDKQIFTKRCKVI